eukprot:CAMPEP_0184363162 /NCGR_PEP_ID=MMETSP1089-20130417/138371_1 /TAXON_ID=38269 ORGANISM="Gloeochaete wittrockiana, Strain SAG46.84" /NCGR_SAMPLE_ID=MMETSP1089 /ASSEMBLY_ACC=CAM_ASM_000445 /LENGTH=128 /DNA_ID=CAMNT_0026703537 /DNA_START=113 /DNA_END=496 /DNA_ORIENTATION=-
MENEGVPEVKLEMSREINFDNLAIQTKITNFGMYRMSPLHQAIWQENVSTFKALIDELKRNDELNDALRTTDRDGRPPLVYALIRKNPQILKVLLDEKAPPSHQNEESEGETPLHYAVYHNFPEAVKM